MKHRYLEPGPNDPVHLPTRGAGTEAWQKAQMANSMVCTYGGRGSRLNLGNWCAACETTAWDQFGRRWGSTCGSLTNWDKGNKFSSLSLEKIANCHVSHPISSKTFTHFWWRRGTWRPGSQGRAGGQGQSRCKFQCQKSEVGILKVFAIELSSPWGTR